MFEACGVVRGLLIKWGRLSLLFQKHCSLPYKIPPSLSRDEAEVEAELALKPHLFSLNLAYM